MLGAAIAILAADLIWAQHLKSKALAGLEEPPYRISGDKLVSIVVPALQEEDYLETLLVSACNQTYAPLEVVISDSSPEDSKAATKSLAQGFGARVVDYPKGNVSAARNTGAGASQGDYLLFLDADCIMCPDFVERLKGKLDEGFVLAHGIDCCHDNEVHNLAYSSWGVIKTKSHTTGRGVMLRASDFWAIGGYNEVCNPAEDGCREDLDLGARVIDAYGEDKVSLDKGAVVSEWGRRPYALLERAWKERGWRNGMVIEARR